MHMPPIVVSIINLTSLLLDLLLQLTPLSQHLGETLLKYGFILGLIHFQQELQIAPFFSTLRRILLIQ